MNSISTARSEMARQFFEVAAATWPASELQRVQATLDAWAGRATSRPHPGQVAKGFFMSGLRDEPWVPISHFPFIDLLRENHSLIKDEARQFLDGSIAPPPYGLAHNAAPTAAPLKGNPERWREWRLYRTGLFYEEKCARFPKTTAVLRSLLQRESFMMNAIFLILGPGEHLPPHADQNNIFVNIWLPLVTPDGCYLTVKDKTVRPQSGEIFAFNHSYIHSAGNHGSSDRVVLALSVYHPELTEVERQVIATLAPMLADAAQPVAGEFQESFER